MRNDFISSQRFSVVLGKVRRHFLTIKIKLTLMFFRKSFLLKSRIKENQDNSKQAKQTRK